MKIDKFTKVKGTVKDTVSKSTVKKMPSTSTSSTKITKGDWKTMPKDKKGMVSYDTIKKTRASKLK
jgi:hypothetical protein